MIGALPRYAQAPLDYRYPLDAAMPWLAGCPRVAVLCHIPELGGEVSQRIPAPAGPGPASAALWIEPQVHGWQADLAGLAERLAPGAPLAIVASQPLARILPERRAWPDAPLGLQPGGLRRLGRALAAAGLPVEQRHGVHAVSAILTNQLGQRLAQWGRPELGDRLEFAARLRYRAAAPWDALATVGLWLARRQA